MTSTDTWSQYVDDQTNDYVTNNYEVICGFWSEINLKGDQNIYMILKLYQSDEMYTFGFDNMFLCYR